MPGITLPPFPENIPTHPLLVIDYELLKAGDSAEAEKLWKAATELGFWYLKNHGADEEVEGMFEMGRETFDLPLEEKMKFVHGAGENSFGYKAVGSFATNEYGDPDNAEFINVAKEDALAYPEVVRRTYPSTVYKHMESTIIPFAHKSLGIVDTIYSVFEKKLGLPEGAIRACHPLMENSNSECRTIKYPAKHAYSEGPIDKAKVSLGAHTDIGSLSFLHNRLGGLQVLPPGNPDWHYILPIPGHAICNIGDALALLSGGILRSNMHRVVPPPGEQCRYARWSAVFFSRPASNCPLRALEGTVIKETLAQISPEQRAKFNSGVTQGEWYTRRVDNQRAKNRTGPETWRASRGMEHTPDII
ncbi:Clavaminate synthase-like protein [Fomitiporia mediterranea MF3/22]|uniref:Clavaminate synthase-like protein n=1 Tax=Fomitiporia mediterranea (strain MF3/22) TaxID=694068 RepID=UPI000440885D|nr:Clavaminate synthase-like protein [Fomitiporia mediterranea MF3/22]EJD06909.1 Clavaminate synthase-like protein [Fomitiporia mediterranea MF3/22]